MQNQPGAKTQNEAFPELQLYAFPVLMTIKLFYNQAQSS